MSLVDKVASATPDTGAPTTPPAATATPATPETPATPASTASTDWYYDENLKGEGSKPEWLKDKYKSAADQAKAYTELEKKLGAFKGAPDKYDLTLPQHPDVKFSENDPLLNDFMERSKKHGVSQEFFSEMLETYANALTANVPDFDAELAKLGPNAPQEITSLVNWGNSQFTSEEMNVFKGLLTTAESVRFFEKLRNIATSSDIAPPSNPNIARESVDQVTALVSDPRYNTSEVFRNEVKERLRVAMSHQKKG